MTEITEDLNNISGEKQEIKQEESTITTPLDKIEGDVKVEGLTEELYNAPPKPKPHRFQPGESGNLKGRPKEKVFSLKADILKSLKRIKKKKPQLYEEIIDSYWKDAKKRELLLEIIDGKARQSMDIGGNMTNPIRIIEIKPMTPLTNEEGKPNEL